MNSCFVVDMLHQKLAIPSVCIPVPQNAIRVHRMESYADEVESSRESTERQLLELMRREPMSVMKLAGTTDKTEAEVRYAIKEMVGKDQIKVTKTIGRTKFYSPTSKGKP